MSGKEAYLDESLTFEERAKDLVSKMTFEEKASQVIYHSAAIPRLKVKAYNWWNEALHGVARAGVATVFPQAIALAAAFDEDLTETVADVISTEGRAKFNAAQKFGDRDIYKGLTFWSPNVNIFRDPRWGRGHETFGEDPYLTSRLGVRFVKGLQGKGKYYKSAACAKHFAVHSGPENIRHEFDAVVSQKDLRETYLPAFKALVQEAGVEAVMGAYNRTNGEPCCGSKTLLVDILRDEWKFKGHVVSDCWAINDFHQHHKITATVAESAALALNNGCDLNCGSAYGYIAAAHDEGLITEETLTRSVERLMTARMRLGHFDENVPYDKIPYTDMDTDANKLLNLRVSERGLVLLKNTGVLPLKKYGLRTIGVIGPNADSRRALVGNYEGTPSEHKTVLEGIRDYAEWLGGNIRVMYSEGCHLYKDRTSGLAQADDRLSEALAVADASDVIVFVTGLNADIEGEEGDASNEFSSGDKKTLDLPGRQLEVLKKVADMGKPVILVNISGSAINLTEADESDKIAAIVQAFYPGALGGLAIARLLFGEFSPEGKLPVTFYRTTEELPEFTDYAMKGRTYRYMTNEALYPFGFGKSYTNFECSALSVEGAISETDTVRVRVNVRNAGFYDGAEVVQLYVKAADVKDAPNWSLKGFKKVRLFAGHSTDVEFVLGKEAFGLFDDDGTLTLNGGRYEIYVGTSQPDTRSAALLGKAPLCAEIRR